MQFRNIRSSFWLGSTGRCLISVDVSIPRGTSLVEPVSEGSVWRQGRGCLVELSVLGGDLAARKVGSILSCIWFYMRQLRGRGQALLELFVALGCIRATPLVLSMWPCKLHLDKEKQNMPVWLSKMVLAQYFCTQFAEAGKRHSKTEHLPKNINMIWLTLPLSDWPIITIGLG
jgi:hypothetical protein